MERGSSKHSPHVDEEMAREARSHLQGSPGGSRAAEWRDVEATSDEAPEPQWIPQGQRPDGAPVPLTGADLEARSQLGRAIPRSVLPGDRQRVLQGAEQLQVTPEIRAELARLPAGRTYHTIYEIWDALGYGNEE
jgi:hypothetical protein